LLRAQILQEDLALGTRNAPSVLPYYIVTTLANKDDKLLDSKPKIVSVSSESGSITLRHESEGGGNYRHRASKAAPNM
jgi:hypothetical protein